MKLIVSPVNSQKKILLLGNIETGFYKTLLHYFHEHEIEVVEPKENYKDTNIETIFIINPPKNMFHIQAHDKNTKICYVFTNTEEKTKSRARNLLKNASLNKHRKKCVLLASDTDSKEIVEKVIWFLFSSSKEELLQLNNQPHIDTSTKHIKTPQKKGLPLKRIVLLCLLLSHILFILPLTIGGVLIMHSMQQLSAGNQKEAKKHLTTSKTYVSATQITYHLAEPLFRFIYISSITDNLIHLQSLGYTICDNAITMVDNTKRLMTLTTLPSRSIPEQKEVQMRISMLQTRLKKMHRDVEILSSKLKRTPFIPKTKLDQIDTLKKTLDQGLILVPQLPRLLGNSKPKKYLIYFLNNMEIRPGGGFIGSFATLTTEGYGLSNFNVFDVYDADGQLKGHIEPPQAIAMYLKQPHLFLRDSHFSPDFMKNTETGEAILQKEIPTLGPFDGSIGVTTTALVYILNAYKQLSLPDSTDNITPENFYLKTQVKTEKNHFDGSKTKKNYLASIAGSMIESINKADLKELISAIKQSLDEKHLVISLKNTENNIVFQKLGWTGSLEPLRCLYTQEKCLVNYIQAVDANLGVNKANYYISRLMYVKDTLKNESTVTTKATILFKNQSPGDVFPGGTYKNYFQLFIPQKAKVYGVKINGQKTEIYNTKIIGEYAVISVFMTIPPQQDSTFEINYDLDIHEARVYQFIIQKQIGSINNELSYEIDPGQTNTSIVPLNFDTLEKNSLVHYNTSLLTDRVLLLRLK